MIEGSVSIYKYPISAHSHISMTHSLIYHAHVNLQSPLSVSFLNRSHLCEMTLHLSVSVYAYSPVV